MNHMCTWSCCIQFSNFCLCAERLCLYLYAKPHTLWSRDRTQSVWKYFRKQEYLFYKRKLGKWSVWSSRAAFNRTAVEFLWSFQTLPYWSIKFSILKKNQLRSWQFYRFAYSRQYSEYTSTMAEFTHLNELEALSYVISKFKWSFFLVWPPLCKYPTKITRCSYNKLYGVVVLYDLLLPRHSLSCFLLFEPKKIPYRYYPRLLIQSGFTC